MRRGLTPKGFRIREYPAFELVSYDAQIKWKEILYNAKKNLVELLLYESSNVAAKLEIDLNNKLLNRHPNDQKVYIFQKTQGLEKEKESEKGRLKKWKKIGEKLLENHTNSLKIADYTTSNYTTESHQQEQASDYKHGAMSLGM